MHDRGVSKRHTVACSDDLAACSNVDSLDVPLAHSPAPAGGRTRRSGLLTVMERPPGTMYFS